MVLDFKGAPRQYKLLQGSNQSFPTLKLPFFATNIKTDGKNPKILFSKSLSRQVVVGMKISEIP